MSLAFRRFTWKPSLVSWFSFFLMGLIVVGIGLLGTAHVIDYLKSQVMDHSIEHNQEIATELISSFQLNIDTKLKEISDVLSSTVDTYDAFGYRIFVLDAKQNSIVIDTASFEAMPIPIEKSWLANATLLNGDKTDILPVQGAIRVIGEKEYPSLIWLQGIEMPNASRYVLGIAKDEKALSDFMDDLHWHLDAVLLLTYVLIALMGYFTLRRIGRFYEMHLETQLEQRTKQLEKAHEDILLKTRLATIGQTASVLTHEMRNPLASIKLALSSIKGSKNIEARELRRVELVVGEVDRLDDLLSETLDYVRPIKLSDTPVDVDEILNKVIAQEQLLIEKHSINLQYHGCNNCTSLPLDISQIHQVFLNLIKNAIEASPEQAEIIVSLIRENKQLIIEIVNDSEPLKHETIDRAFEPFFTTKPKGTGLGLGLVKRVVEEHGGSVTFQQLDNNKVCAKLVLPASL